MKATKLTKGQYIKVIKTIGYLCISTAIGALIGYLQGHPELVGAYGPIINAVLVYLKQVFTEGGEARGL